MKSLRDLRRVSEGLYSNHNSSGLDKPERKANLSEVQGDEVSYQLYNFIQLIKQHLYNILSGIQSQSK